jgi:hypothetical protein
MIELIEVIKLLTLKIKYINNNNKIVKYKQLKQSILIDIIKQTTVIENIKVKRKINTTVCNNNIVDEVYNKEFINIINDNNLHVIYNYYNNSDIINRIRQLKELKYGSLKISKILINEGYKGYKEKKITREVVRNIINKYL